MNILEMVKMLKTYSNSNKPFFITFKKLGNEIVSFTIVDYPELKKWKAVNKQTYSDFLKQCKRTNNGVSFISITGNNKLIIPCKPAKHIQDFSKKNTIEYQVNFWKYVFKQAKHEETIYTHGSDIGYLHVKIKRF